MFLHVYHGHGELQRLLDARLLQRIDGPRMWDREPNPMNPRRALLVAIVSATALHAQSIGSTTVNYGQPRATKAENGLIISWVAGNAGTGQVDIFDEHGNPMTSFNALRPVEEAREVSIYDVSARPGSAIAVAAVYTSMAGNLVVPPAAALLLFDFNGRLRSAYALPPSAQIEKLVVDESSNIWILTDNFSDTDPPDVPMIVEYTQEGSVIRELLPHSVLWSHGAAPRESSATGIITMGCESGVVWVWLPGSTDLVTISAKDGALTRAQTQLPKKDKHNLVPLDVSREPSGEIIGVFRDEGETGGSDLAYYMWSPSTRLWSSFRPGQCDGERLLGIGNAGEIYAGFGDRAGDICAFQPK
jgi:hypothetical protein